MNLAEMAVGINAAVAKLSQLSGKPRGGANPEKLKLIRSLRSDILAARMRDANWQDISAIIQETTGAKITPTTLVAYMKKFDEEDKRAAQKISRTLAEKHSAKGAEEAERS